MCVPMIIFPEAIYSSRVHSRFDLTICGTGVFPERRLLFTFNGAGKGENCNNEKFPWSSSQFLFSKKTHFAVFLLSTDIIRSLLATLKLDISFTKQTVISLLDVAIGTGREATGREWPEENILRLGLEQPIRTVKFFVK